MSLLAGVTKATNAEKETDRIGGFQLLDSGVHPLGIEVAYLQTAASGARALVFSFKGDAGSLRATEYFCSGDAKGNKTYYEKDGKQYNLPGFTLVNDIFLAAGIAGGIDGAVVEEKVINVYSRDEGKEVPTKVHMVTNLLGKKVALGVIKSIEDKTAKGDDGEYHATGETREQNSISKVFTMDGYTVLEREAGATEPAFIVTWKDKYEGQVIDNSDKSAASQAGNAGAPQGGSAPAKLFS